MVRVVVVANASALDASGVTVISPNAGPLPGTFAVTAQRPPSEAGTDAVVHAVHSGVMSGNVLERWAIAFSIGWLLSVTSGGRARERRKPCPFCIGWLSTSGK